ncbi:transmembrane channel-like protein 6 [Sarcophilus harrisii]|uniref:Transmembrane channel-like protein n=1 Tax=Sarcophilus harrisii TaxID=9305 RepID=G3X1M8_SARHA|nr:transmembrane channel-like protein 6 [Sarcophilus harrisii]XP_023358420.1 transmembrane channel-like protein 6 [Sarcophilus harrisii]XP_023358422.1 transmembrane channel-like protein 6 [Sarcophilus harrisii]XP_023358424.1 transmembrane channel-like protein 6 [Sarcophilus harrisii]XP_023358425.1 transmembrane channel-like protein 6 [Sarcophilus harrisii]XP_031821426.1 transmembrane channel-like protein 6 [Sarcophilus harrisii]XP_031821427.1 transmembrane channel-like protein 6 [Sarcophilus 
MSRTPSFVLPIPEGRESSSQDLSPYDESIVHDSFHQLIQEQSQRAEAESLELQEWPPRDKGGGSQLHGAPQEYSSATLRILANMPSRTIGRSRGAIISQYYNQTVKLRRKNSRPLLRDMSRSARPSIRQYDLEFDLTPREEEEKRSLLVEELQGLTITQRNHMLQNMPLSLTEKRCLRQDIYIRRGRQRCYQISQTQLYCCSHLKYHCIIAFRSLWYGLLSGLYALKPWRYSLKQISGQFGSSVLSYFLFLKTLVSFNILLLLLLLPFIVAVQVAFPPTSESSNFQSFTGLELFTGGGPFTHTVMYYGYYSNFTLNQPCSSHQSSDHCPANAVHLPYNMPLAYLFTIGFSFFITCITLVYSMSRSFGKSYRVGSTLGVHAITVFCSWDYNVTQKWASRLQHDNIRTQLKELLAEWQLKQYPRSVCGRLRQMTVLFLVWLLSLASVLGCAIAVYSFSEFMHENHEIRTETISEKLQEARLLVLPLIVCIINLVVPYFYNVLAICEQHDSPVLEVYVAICRNLILKMVILGLLCYHWMGRKVKSLEDQCWETFVGQELYRFMVMDFIFTLVDTLFGELVWRLISEKLKRDRKPEFDVARNVLELIYGQTLTWLGVLFSPLLPVIQVLKLLFLFYIKKISLMANCQAPRKPWRASHMTTIFITLLCFPSFLGAAIFLSYAIWQVRPSRNCGPFRTLDTIYEAGKVWIRRLEEASPSVTWFTWIHQNLVENTFFIFLMSIVLLVAIYFNIQVVKGQRKVICLLKEHINNEGEDKIFLINKIHSIYEKKAVHQ